MTNEITSVATKLVGLLGNPKVNKPLPVAALAVTLVLVAKVEPFFLRTAEILLGLGGMVPLLTV
jgi:hypothetical protein